MNSFPILYLQMYLCGLTKPSCATDGVQMEMGANVEEECHGICVPPWDHRPGTTGTTRMGVAVDVGCSGHSRPQTLSPGLGRPGYAIAGLLMGMGDSVAVEWQINCVRRLEHIHQNIVTIRMVGVEGAECRGSCLCPAVHPSGRAV